MVYVQAHMAYVQGCMVFVCMCDVYTMYTRTVAFNINTLNI